MGGSTEVNEIIDFGDSSSNCTFPDFEGAKQYIHSTLQRGRFPLGCGSSSVKNEGRDCYLYQNDGTLKTYYNVTKECRYGSASAYVPDKGWWFTGGTGAKSTSEIINIDTMTTSPGPNLPKRITKTLYGPSK